MTVGLWIVVIAYLLIGGAFIKVVVTTIVGVIATAATATATKEWTEGSSEPPLGPYLAGLFVGTGAGLFAAVAVLHAITLYGFDYRMPGQGLSACALWLWGTIAWRGAPIPGLEPVNRACAWGGGIGAVLALLVITN